MIIARNLVTVCCKGLKFVFYLALFCHFELILIICVSFLLCMQEVFGDITFQSHYPQYGPLLQSLDATDLAHIEHLGLSSLCQIPAVIVNHSLLTALVERFHSETNTFHLPMGEMTVTPEDI